MLLRQQTVKIASESNFSTVFRRIKITHSLSAQIVLSLMLQNFPVLIHQGPFHVTSMNVTFHLLTESIQRKGSVFLFRIEVGKPGSLTIKLLSLSLV